MGEDEHIQNEHSEDEEPKMPSNPLKKVKTAGKTVVNTTYKISKRVIGFFTNPAIPLPIKIAVIAVIIIIIIVVVILDAKADETANAVNDSIKSYVSSKDVDAEGKKYFEEKASLIKMPLKDINAIYEKYKKDGKFSNDIVKEYDYIIGTRDVKDGGDASSSASSASYDLINMVKKAVAMAQKGGIAYGSDGRQTASTLEELDAITKTDCSGLVYSLFKVYLGIDVGADSESMKANGESKHSENGWTAEIHAIGDGELQPGDILYRYNHVGIYVGSYGDKNHVDHGGPGDGPNLKNYEDKGNKYTHYIRYTNPNATNNGGNIDPNGNASEGYTYGFTSSSGKSYKGYKQYEEPWKSHDYWKGKMQKYGCGPTTVAIVASGYGKNVTPGDVADYIMAHGSQKETNSTTLSEALTNLCKLKNTVYNSNFESKIREELKSGRPVVVSVGSSPDTKFTATGHLIAFLDIRNDSEVFIANAGRNDDLPENKETCGWNDLKGVIPYITYIITIDE